ncbi:aggregation-promoting factor C-terminal-like domain-containing protein [Streptomyces rimosus]|uniref:aggregation-promoting factor C-terminal-like domain-containing protein n=1 Tax=Streptomyces rimosus TaxID=1927 RepID=UPI000D12B682|nr:CHAP domain-containing protein [Streptomyces rimosus]
MQEQTVRAVGRTADEAGRAFERGFVPKVSAALEGMATESAEAGKRSEAALKGAATRAAKAQARAIDWVVQKEGEGAAAVVRLAFKAADEKHQALKGLASRHKRVLSTMGLDEEVAVKSMVRASQLGEARKQAAFKETGLQYKATLRENHTALNAHLREGLRDYKAAKAQEISAERETTLAYKAELSERLGALRAELAATTRAQEGAMAAQAGLAATAASRWRKGSQQIEHMGTQSVELAGLLSRNIIVPLATAGGLATSFGIKATDSFDKAANSLGGLGVSLAATKELLNNLQQFAINSSFSLEDMNDYAPQYVRILTSHGTNPDKAARQSEALIKAIANNAAKGGITDPEKLARAMQQIAYILDTDKLTLRNLKPFENATNVSMQQVATMLGYKDKAGPVRGKGQHYTRRDGKWIKDNDGAYVQDGFKGGKPRYIEDKGTGKSLSASAQLMADMTKSRAPSGTTFIDALIQSGVQIDGAAKKAQNATVKGRLQAMKESFQRDLMGLFAKRDKDGNFEVRRDPATGMQTHVKTELYENVLKALDGATELWKDVFPGLKVGAKAFVDGLNTVIDIGIGTAEFIRDHPALQEALKTAVSFTVKALPLLIAFGVTAKILGKFGKLLGGVGTSAKLFGSILGSAGKGVMAISRGAKHAVSGVKSRRESGSFLDGYRASRSRSAAAREDGWGWSNRLRGQRDNARRRWGASRFDTVRGYTRAGLQYGSGGLIDFDERDARRRSRRDFRTRDRALRARRERTPQTADYATDHVRTAREIRQNRQQQRDARRSPRRRAHERYSAAFDGISRSRARGDISDDERDSLARQLRGERGQERRSRRRTARRAAGGHLPAVPMPQEERLKLDVSDAEKAIKALQEKIKALDLELKRVNEVRLPHIQGEFDGSAQSISHSAVKAREAIDHIRSLGLTPLNSADLNQIQGRLSGAEGSSLEHSASKAETAARKIRTRGLEPLNGVNLGQAQAELNGAKSSLGSSASGAARKVSSARSAITDLNEQASTARVRRQFDGPKDSLKASVQDSKASVTRLASAIRNLKDISLETIKRKLNGAGSLKSSVNDVKNTVGVPSGKSGLNPALNKINSVSFRSAEKKLKDLKDKVDKVTKATDGLSKALKDVDDATGGGGGKSGGGKKNGGGKKKRSAPAPRARGYSYTGVHASFGGGAIGPSAGAGSAGSSGFMARSAAAPFGGMSLMAAPAMARSAGSSGGGGGGFSSLFGGVDELRRLLDLSSLARTTTAALGVDRATTGLGAMGKNLRGWVGSKVTWAGQRFSGLPDGLTEWFTKKMPSWLTKQPEGAPWTQLAGLATGMIAPVVGDAFMSQVYHGHGNVVGRSKRMAGDIFSLDTLGEVFDNLQDLIKDVWSGVKALLKLALRFITDPGGVLGDLKDWATEQFSGFVGMFRDSWAAVQAIASDPSEYAKDVLADLLAGLKDALPNLDGLLDFSKGYANGGVVPGYAPGRDSVHTLVSPGESILRPEITRMLGTDQIDGMNAAARGGNFKSLAELIERMWRTLIQPSFVSMSQEVRTDLSPTTEKFRATSVDTWTTVAKTVQSSWQTTIQPSMTAWSTRIRGDLTQSEREFLAAHQTVWSNAAQQVSRSKTSSLSSFGALSSGVNGLRDTFRSAGSAIQSSWRAAMSYVDSSTRSTVSGPYNRGVVSMTSAMASLAGASAPLRVLKYAFGGVVPGYSPGNDTVPAVLSPGEGILRPEVVKALGANTIHEWNRAARLGGNTFANGGVVKPLGWKSQTGAEWVDAHKNDPFDGYADAISRGWSQNIAAMTKALRDAFGTMGGLNAGTVDHFKSSIVRWGKYLDDHVGGASAAVKSAQGELGYTETGPNLVKYNQFNGEEWCADFISWVVDKAGANSSYWNSPKGTPGNRWPSVSTWNAEAAGSRISASQARSGDIVTFRNGGHIGLVESVANGVLHTIEGNVGPTVRRLTRSMSDPDHVFRARGGIAKGESFSGWPGAYAKDVAIPDAGGLDGGTPAQNKAVAKQLLNQMGWGSQFGALDPMWTRESGWNQFAKNPSSGAYGIPQSLPANKMASAGRDWLTNPVTQERWGLGYIKDRYGSPEKAWDFWRRNHWYARGTRSASPGLALVGEQGPELVEMRGGERVHSAPDTAALLGGRMVTVNVTAAPDVPTEETILRALDRAHLMHGL